MYKIRNFFIANPNNNYQPGILKPRFIFTLSVALIFARLLTVPSVTEGTAVESQTLMNLVNQERSNRNLPTLLAHSALQKAATVKSQDMIDRDYFAHQNPDGQYIWGEVVAAGYGPYKILGENLAVDFSTSEGMVQAWIDSPTHRENLLHPDFVHQGLAALYGDYQGRYTNLTTNLFGALATSSQQPNPATPNPEPASPPPVSDPEPTVQPVQTPAPDTAEPELEQPTESDISEFPPTPDEPKIIEDPSKSDPNTTDPTDDFQNKSDASTSQTNNPQINIIKLLFTIFGAGFLVVLIFDSVIIYRKETRAKRGHPSYHLFIFVLLVLVSILVWWWG